jgi:hypothetical protein
MGEHPNDGYQGRTWDGVEGLQVDDSESGTGQVSILVDHEQSDTYTDTMLKVLMYCVGCTLCNCGWEAVVEVPNTDETHPVVTQCPALEGNQETFEINPTRLQNAGTVFACSDYANRNHIALQ